MHDLTLSKTISTDAFSECNPNVVKLSPKANHRTCEPQIMVASSSLEMTGITNSSLPLAVMARHEAIPGVLYALAGASRVLAYVRDRFVPRDDGNVPGTNDDNKVYISLT